MAEYYDFETINREIPIEDVLAYFDIYPTAQGKYSIRPEDKTASAGIDKRRRFGNTIHDFGTDNNFTPLTLTMYLKNLSDVEASQLLGRAFGIQPKSFDNTPTDPYAMSNWEWELINIQPDMASKNMDFHPETHGDEKTRNYAEKYRIPISDLRKSTDEKDKEIYEHILCSRALPYILEKRNMYLRGMYSQFALAKEVYSSFDEKIAFESEREKFEDLAKELLKLEGVFKKAINGTSIKFKANFYNAQKDFNAVINGDISFEMGQNSYYSIKEAARDKKTKPFYCSVSLEEYFKLMRNGLEDIQFAAFQKGSQVNIAFLPSDSSRINYLVRALRGKEIDLNKAFDDKSNENTKSTVTNGNINKETSERQI